MIPVGGIVPLTLQLYDGAENKTVHVEVYDPEGNPLFVGTMNHLVKGLYEVSTFTMPDVPFVVAQYTVMDGEKISKDYVRVSDMFRRMDPPDMTEIVNALTPKAAEPTYIGKLIS